MAKTKGKAKSKTSGGGKRTAVKQRRRRAKRQVSQVSPKDMESIDAALMGIPNSSLPNNTVVSTE